MRTPWGAIALLLAATVLSCGSTPPKPKPPSLAKPTASAHPKADGMPPFPAHTIASLDDENVTPYFARRGAEGLLVSSSRGRWVAQPIAADGAPKGAPVDLGAVSGAVPLGALRPVGQGYIFVWVEQVEKNHAVKALALDAGGKSAGRPELVTQSVDELSWVDVMPNATGSLVLWEIPRADRSDIVVAPLAGAKPVGAPTTVLSGALGWEVVATDRGAAFAVVMPGNAPPAKPSAEKASGDKSGGGKAAPGGAAGGGHGGKPAPSKAPPSEDQGQLRLGRVSLIEVDAQGKPAAPAVVSAELTAQIDVDVAEVGGRYVLAWTDQRDLDATIYVAAVEPGGKLAVAPRPATPPSGEQALVALVASPGGGRPARAKRALLAWEDLLKSPRDGRQIYLATLGPDGILGTERATLVFGASGPPDLVADADGFAAVTLAPAALEGTKPGREQPVWPTFVRFGADLSVLSAEPVRAAPFAATEGVPYLTRNLSCNAGSCSTLASGSGVPATLAAVTLSTRKSPWRSPAWRQADDPPPHASSVRALYDGQHLADVAATALEGGGSLVAWVTYFVPTPGAKKQSDDAPSATIGVRPIAASGVAAKPVTISTHALSIGGVAIAPAPGGKTPETALAWVAKERGEPQVFVTKIGADGSKLAQKGVTVISRKTPKPEGKAGRVVLVPPNEASDVAIAYAGGGDGNDGWIVAWVDTRDGNAEVYVAKVDRSLGKIVPDRRITNALGDAAEVQIVVRGKETFLVWSDARQNPEEGSGDIWLARLDTKSLNKLGEETRLFASGAHSRSPVLAPTPNGFTAAWIEEAAEGSKSAGEAGLRIASLDAKGTVIGAPALLRLEGAGAVTSTALVCAEAKCRGALTSIVGEGVVLGGFELAPGGAPSPVKTLATLTGGATEDVSPIFSSASGEQLFFADDSVDGNGRVRWMTIAWPAKR